MFGVFVLILFEGEIGIANDTIDREVTQSIGAVPERCWSSPPGHGAPQTCSRPIPDHPLNPWDWNRYMHPIAFSSTFNRMLDLEETTSNNLVKLMDTNGSFLKKQNIYINVKVLGILG